jgi:hypothetical protein
MKKFFRILAILALFPALTLSQNKADMNYPFGIGAFAAANGGVNAADVPQGIKNGFMINSMPNIGAQMYVPFAKTGRTGLLAELAYSSYIFELKKALNESVDWENQFNYISIAPYLYVHGFMTGFNFGIPVSGRIANNDVDSGDMGLAVEFKMGVVIPVYEDKTGRANLVLRAGYFLTGVYSENRTHLPCPVATNGTEFNLHPASGSIGFSYIFNLPDK